MPTPGVRVGLMLGLESDAGFSASQLSVQCVGFRQSDAVFRCTLYYFNVLLNDKSV